MKKLSVFIIFLAAINTAFAQKKVNRAVLRPGPSTCQCSTDRDKAFVNMWKEPNGKDYVIELQFLYAGTSTCNFQMDSIYIFKPGILARPGERYRRFSEFTAIYGALSTDRNTYRLQYKIPASVFIDPMHLGSPLAAYINFKFGTARCQIYETFEVTDALL